MGKFFYFVITYFLFFLYTSQSEAQIFQRTTIKFYENGQPTFTGTDAGMFPDSPTRTKIDLSGYWLYTIDGKSWQNVQIPSAYDYEGEVIFQRKFEIKKEMLERYNFFLVAYGINYQCEIHINGNFITRHIGGYSSFIATVRENVLQIGNENTIKVIVNNELNTVSTIPLRHQVDGWKNYGGIFRDIYLLATPKIFVNEPNIKSEISSDYKNAKLKIKFSIENTGFTLPDEDKSKNIHLAHYVEVFEKFNDIPVSKSTLIPVDVPPKKIKDYSLDLSISNPKLWSPENPELYIIKLYIVKVDGKEIIPLDVYIANYGIKDLRIKDSEILLNGKSIYLNGVLYNEQHPFYASALTYELMEKDIVKIKNSGANLIRFLHPPHPYFINLCDRYGLLVMEDLPLNQIPANILKKEYYLNLASDYLKDIIARDKNSVSVLAYGLGNEVELTKETESLIKQYLSHLRLIVKNIDDRPVYLSALLHWNLNEIKSELNILAINIYPQGEEYFSNLKSILMDIRMKHQDKVIIVGRYGKEINPENKNGYSDQNSVEYQAWYAWQIYNTIKESKFSGSVFWAYNDWISDRPSLISSSGNPYLKAMGMVSINRNPRIVYDVIRNIFNNEKITAIPVGNYAPASPMIYVILGLIILITIAFFYNSNRRFRENINRSMFRTYNFFADVRDQRIIPISHTFFLVVLFSVNFAVIISSIALNFRYNLFIDNILTQFLTDPLKTYLVKLIWNPTKFIIHFSIIIFLKFLIIILLIKFISLFTRVKVYLYHIFSITVWAFVPTIALMPLAMILFRIIIEPVYLYISLIIIFLILIISIFRLFKGISIIFDVSTFKVYALGILIIILIAGITASYLEQTKSTFVFLKYFIETRNIF
ncbi:MAG: Beta-galactosidase [Ignavibacteriae bacterium]|nr:MAG: Beta-galactosidase [Ignavibacteriota bacterium]